MPGAGGAPPPPVHHEHEHSSADNAGAAPPAPGLAMQHRTEHTRTYPCSACGGQLEFDIAQQKLACPHCGNVQELQEVSDQPVVERDLRAAMDEMRTMAAAGTQTVITGEKEVVCQNCGGHTTFTGTLTSTRCPYCATPIQRDDVHDAPARLAVDGVLPFAVDNKTAEANLQKWISSRWFAPNEFKQYSRTGSFASVYAAYFTYDAEATTWYRGQRGDNYTVTVGSGDNRRTETRIRWSRVSGQVYDTFDDLAVHANEGFDEGHIQALEPWPTQQVKPFSPEFVAGHLSRTYDRDVEACFATAQGRMEQAIESTIRRDIGGDHQRIESKQTSYGTLSFKHLLLPIWLLTVIYAGQPFQVLMNGVTGEVHGERPYSKVKIAFAIVAAVLLAIVITLVVQRARGG